VRRPRIIAGLAALSLTFPLASCASVAPKPAAEYGGVELADDDFTALLRSARDLPGIDRFVLGETAVTGDFARNLLTRWIAARVLEEDLERRGLGVSDDDRAALEAELIADPGSGWSEASPEVRVFFLDIFAVEEAFRLAGAPPDDELRAAYDAGAEVSGVVCTRHILTLTEADAVEVLDELDGGADFATLAAERSTDAASGANWGIIEPSPGAACFTTVQISQSLIPEYVDAAIAARPGVPTEPVQSQFGFHVILVRPFDEVADAVRNIVGGSASLEAEERLVTGASAEVNPKYGRWVAERALVLPVGRG
jgi:hypothetical protein